MPLGCGAWLYVGRGGKEELSSFVELDYALSVYYYSRVTFGLQHKTGVSYHAGFRGFLLKLGILRGLPGFLWYNFRVTRRFQVFLGRDYGFIVTPTD